MSELQGSVESADGSTAPAPVVVGNVEQLRALIGRTLGPGRWMPIEQSRIDAFAAATGDAQWIHCDPARAARESPFHTTVAHGYLTLSLGPMLADELRQFAGLQLALNYGLNRVRFPQGVPSGARVRLSLEVLEVQPTAPAGSAVQVLERQTFQVEGFAKPACVAEMLLRLAWPQ